MGSAIIGTLFYLFAAFDMYNYIFGMMFRSEIVAPARNSGCHYCVEISLFFVPIIQITESAAVIKKS